MKKVLILLVLVIGVLLVSGPAYAGEIGFGGGYVTVNSSHQFTFSNSQVITVDGDISDALASEMAGMVLTGTYTMNTPSAGVATFTSDTGTLTLGNATLGTLVGTVQLMTITDHNGMFDIAIQLTNVNITPGTGPGASALLTQWAGQHPATMAVNFAIATGYSLQGLYDLAEGKYYRESYSGSVSVVPEPATLALLGTSFLAGGGWLRRRILK